MNAFTTSTAPNPFLLSQILLLFLATLQWQIASLGPFIYLLFKNPKAFPMHPVGLVGTRFLSYVSEGYTKVKKKTLVQPK